MNAVRQTKNTPELIASAGCGSAIVEAVYALAGAPLAVESLPYDDLATNADLRARNPLAQVPTLVLPDGTVLTESAAIVLHLAATRPQAKLAPSAEDATYATFLRWLVFTVGAIYPTFHHGDLVAANADANTAQAIQGALAQRREAFWRHVDAAAVGPWFLGARRSAIDVVIGVMARWSPGLDWFSSHAPKLHAIATRVAAEPTLREIFARNFG